MKGSCRGKYWITLFVFSSYSQHPPFCTTSKGLMAVGASDTFNDIHIISFVKYSR